MTEIRFSTDIFDATVLHLTDYLELMKVNNIDGREPVEELLKLIQKEKIRQSTARGSYRNRKQSF